MDGENYTNYEKVVLQTILNIFVPATTQETKHFALQKWGECYLECKMPYHVGFSHSGLL